MFKSVVEKLEGERSDELERQRRARETAPPPRPVPETVQQKYDRELFDAKTRESELLAKGRRLDGLKGELEHRATILARQIEGEEFSKLESEAANVEQQLVGAVAWPDYAAVEKGAVKLAGIQSLLKLRKGRTRHLESSLSEVRKQVADVTKALEPVASELKTVQRDLERLLKAGSPK